MSEQANKMDKPKSAETTEEMANHIIEKVRNCKPKRPVSDYVDRVLARDVKEFSEIFKILEDKDKDLAKELQEEVQKKIVSKTLKTQEFDQGYLDKYAVLNELEIIQDVLIDDSAKENKNEITDEMRMSAKIGILSDISNEINKAVIEEQKKFKKYLFVSF